MWGIFLMNKGFDCARRARPRLDSSIVKIAQKKMEDGNTYSLMI